MRHLRKITSQWNGIAIAAMALLAVSFIFGGASRLHAFRLALVELAALPALILASFWMIRQAELSHHRSALLILLGVVLVPIVQILPLPYDVWAMLPGRTEADLALNLAGQQPQWLTISLTPDHTWRSALALIPPAAMFMATLAVDEQSRVRLVAGVLLATLCSLVLAAAQTVMATDKLFLWPTTDVGSVVGFFANRNHLATLCLIAMPFVGALMGGAARRRIRNRNVAMGLGALLIGLLIVALGIIRSRAGIALTVPVLVGTLVVMIAASGRGRPPRLIAGVAVVSAVALTALSVFALGPIIERFDKGTAPEGRFENWPFIVQAGESYLPLGSGIGSFDPVYRSVEPLSLLDGTYLNQAHNEYLEIFLETGWLGLGLLAVFLIWFAKRSFAAWRAPRSTVRDLQIASTVAIAAVLAHSVVDYPIRTATISVLFALCCALLEKASKSAERKSASGPETTN